MEQLIKKYGAVDWNIICGLEKQLMTAESLRELYRICVKYDIPMPKWKFLKIVQKSGTPKNTPSYKALYTLGPLVATMTEQTIKTYLDIIPIKSVDTDVFRYLPSNKNKMLNIFDYLPEEPVPKIEVSPPEDISVEKNELLCDNNQLNIDDIIIIIITTILLILVYIITKAIVCV